MKTSLRILGTVIIIAAVGGYLWYDSRRQEAAPKDQEAVYASEALGIRFAYPDNYFLTEHDESTGERSRMTLILAEDTPENRNVFAGRAPGRDGPPTITIGVFQNNLDHYTTREWVEGTNFSNFKLSDGTFEETSVDGRPALAYDATGLYENKNIAVATPEHVYLFTVFYLSPNDRIRDDFESVIKSVAFSEPSGMPVSLYYYDPARDTDTSGNIRCSREGLVGVERVIPRTETPIQDTIRLLLRGEITEEEAAAGIDTEFPLPGVSLQSASLRDRVLTLEFSDPQSRTSGGSCRAGVLWFQIEATAQQFPSVESVQFIPEELFQP